MQNKAKNQKKRNEPRLVQKVLQTILTIFLLILILEMTGYCFSLTKEDEGDDLWLQREIESGEYADCVDTYHLYYDMYRTEGEEFERFAEFSDFYENYMLCSEYREAAEYLENSSYREQAEKYYAQMQKISADSSFAANRPHYEYLLSKFAFD